MKPLLRRRTFWKGVVTGATWVVSLRKLYGDDEDTMLQWKYAVRHCVMPEISTGHLPP